MAVWVFWVVASWSLLFVLEEHAASIFRVEADPEDGSRWI
jgi:hypothetical protein